MLLRHRLAANGATLKIHRRYLELGGWAYEGLNDHGGTYTFITTTIITILHIRSTRRRITLSGYSLYIQVLVIRLQFKVYI